MAVTIIRYREWEFEVDRELTRQAYETVVAGGADTCACSDCRNYVACRDSVFPDEIKRLLFDVGVDFTKDVEITPIATLPDGLHRIGGWFHFKGRLVSGEEYLVPISGNTGFTMHLTKVADNFSIGFAHANDLTLFTDRAGLVQVEFTTSIPWVIDRLLEAS